MTQPGYQNMVENGTIKLRTFLMSCLVLDEPVSYFFEDDDKPMLVQEIQENYGVVASGQIKNIHNTIGETKKEIEFLRKENENLTKVAQEKDKIIEHLNRYIEILSKNPK